MTRAELGATMHNERRSHGQKRRFGNGIRPTNARPASGHPDINDHIPPDSRAQTGWLSLVRVNVVVLLYWYSNKLSILIQ